ncbi:hypothetical protein [Pseudoalteromonas ruthenica]|nr:hypothetical protein [Pseudoalteromonas ruthenica]
MRYIFLMFPSSSFRQQRGSMLVVAVVVAVLLLALGLALSRVINAGINQNALEYYGARSYMAAQSGIERSLQRLITDSTPSCTLIAGANYSFASRALENCTVAISCASEEGVPEPTVASGAVNFYQITSAAQCSTGSIDVQRSIAVEVRLEG